MGKINLYAENTVQPIEIVKKFKTTEQAVKHLKKKGKKSQNKLIKILKIIKKELNKKKIKSQINDPGVKTYSSSLNNIKRNNNHILKLTDIFRASIIIDDKKYIQTTKKIVSDILNSNNMKILKIKNRFKKIQSMGYKDFSFRIKDLDNDDLIGELQIHLCSINKFNKIVGHFAYESVRNLKKTKQNLKIIKSINKIISRGYQNSLKFSDKNCLNEFKIKTKKNTRKKRIRTRKK